MDTPPRLNGPAPARQRRAVLLATLGLALTATAGCMRQQSASSFEYTLLDGTRHSSSALLGQVVLINFWATSCGVCVEKMPGLAGTHRQFAAQGLQTLAVAMIYDAPARVAHFAEQQQLPFGVVIDNTGAVAQAFGGVQATPTTLLVNRAGRIVWRHEGASSFPKLQTRIAQLLAEAA